MRSSASGFKLAALEGVGARVKAVTVITAILVASLSACGPPSPSPQQVAQGFNGPAEHRTDVFRSAEELRSSWVGSALARSEIDRLTANTDFARNVLVAYSFGLQRNASGRVLISKLVYDEHMPGYYMSVNIGVVPEECGIPFTNSYPFVLGVVPIAGSNAELTGWWAGNFGERCGPIMEAAPTTLPY